MSLAGLINSASAVYGLINVTTGGALKKSLGLSSGYTPSTWKSASKEQMLLVVPNIGGIFFDAIFNYEEDNSVTYTSHPVQNGANISDHGFINPVTAIMDVACSNTMACRQPGGWYTSYTGNKATDAVSAVLTLMKTKQPIKVIAPRSTLTNMVIESINRHEDASTTDVARMSISLRQILIANVGTEKVSARDWTTSDTTSCGEVSPTEESGSTLYEIEKANGG